jgi:hypothetical protein
MTWLCCVWTDICNVCIQVKFTGEGVCMLKKKEGGIACKLPRPVWPVPRPDHPAADRTGPAGPPNCLSEWAFGGPPDQPGRPPGSRRIVRSRRTHRRAVRPRGRRRRTYRRIAAVCSLQRPDSHLPINTPSSSWGRVRTSPTIVHPWSSHLPPLEKHQIP